MGMLKKIKIEDRDEIKGFSILLMYGSVVCLPDNEYLVSKYILNELKRMGIAFIIVEEDNEKI